MVFTVANKDTATARKDDVYLKKPTTAGMRYHRDFLYGKSRRNYYWRGDQPIRNATDREDGQRLDDALIAYPDLRKSLDCYPDWQIRSLEDLRIFLHYLVIHRIHYERLREIGTIGIPEARFLFFRTTLRRNRFVLFGRVESKNELVPAIVQEWIFGTSLWSMYDSFARNILPEWQAHMPVIADQLSRIVESNNFDWNPMNFLYRETDGRLFYIDSKPTTFGGRVTNDHNLASIRRVFLQPYGH